MQLRIVAVGKLREAYWRDAEAEYRKRLSGYATKVEVVEVADEPTPDNASAAQEDGVRRREGERLLARLGEREYVIALDRAAGRAFGSEAFAAHLERRATEGNGAFAFVIGGSLGLHDSILARADLALSFGEFTFPHQMMRVMLLEQVYRAMKITSGQAYHK
ncbi:MAG TPA: 23S rRNA (pseudouridine(1915)-N(3))-methyltransferase RlmH [Armatimonadaceae bacterium]|nr:23S rRNA (pseudouridine(1915)-N(3))-methyltransferase RlmH [Armatimonadaceae bacterium]